MEPTKDYKNHPYGLITPSGEFYPCGYAGHSSLTYALRNKGLVLPIKEYGGSVHISEREADQIYKGYPATQKQFDALFDYYMEQGYPERLPELLVE